MKAKRFGLFVLSVFALVFVMSAISADIVFSPASTNSTINSGQTSAVVNFNLVHTGVGGDYTGLTWTGTSTVGTWTLPTSQTTLNTSQNIPLTATLTGISSTFNGTITGNITVTASGGSPTETIPVTITVTPTVAPTEITACSAIGNQGQLDVKGIDFSNKGMSSGKTFGEDDEWFPFEEVEVEIEVENNGNFDTSDVEVSWGLYDTRANQWVVDFDEEDTFDIDEGDSETFTVTFTLDDDLDVDLDELSDGDNYRLYVVASGTIDDNNAGALDNVDTCISDFEPASIIIEGDFVVLNNLQVPETVSCGETVTVSADVWNIGDSDQDSVSVDVYDKERKLIDKVFEVGDIDAFDNSELSLSFQVPQDAEEKTYSLTFNVLDEDNDVYKNDFDDDLAEFNMPLKVSGGCGAPVSVVGTVVSGGREGQDLVVKATVTNNGNSQKTYTVNAVGFEDWASSFSLDQSLLTLAAGESKDVALTLDVNKDAAGSQTFFLELTSDGQVTRQPVTVTVEESGGFLDGITGNALGGNGLIWGIGILNVILILVIIFVAVRIARK